MYITWHIFIGIIESPEFLARYYILEVNDGLILLHFFPLLLLCLIQLIDYYKYIILNALDRIEHHHMLSQCEHSFHFPILRAVISLGYTQIKDLNMDTFNLVGLVFNVILKLDGIALIVLSESLGSHSPKYVKNLSVLPLAILLLEILLNYPVVVYIIK
jgi:hypothetical protein